MKRAPVYLVVAALTSVVAPAFAQNVAAEALYNKGKELLEAGKFAEACPKFAESQKLDPATGTLFALASCHEKEGKTASAWGEFLQVATLYSRAGKADREKQSRDGAARVEKLLIKVTFSMASPPAGLDILVDGKSVGGAGILGTELPVDPGTRMLSATAPGKKAWEESKPITGNMTVAIPALLDAPKAETTPVVAGAPANGNNGQDPDKKMLVVSPTNTTMRTLGWVGIGVGGAALLTGAGFQFLVAIPKDNTAKSKDVTSSTDPRCASAPAGSDLAQGCDAKKAAKSAQTIAIVSSVAGVVLLGTGIVLVLTSGGSTQEVKAAKRQEGIKVTPTFGFGTVGLNGTF